MKALIFGINGQDGYYLNVLLHRKHIQVIGVSRSKSNWLEGDVANRKLVEEIINEHKPEYIFHLAANSTTKHEALFENHNTISTGTLNILESVYRYSPHSKVFLSGSGLQFVNKGQPISEYDAFEASSPYSVSRIQTVYAARYYRTLGLKVYVGYFFNHDSPLRSERHVNQKIVMAAKRIAGGSKEVLEMGDITVRKEFTYAGDVVDGIWTLVQNNEVYEAVIGSGKAYSIEQWIEICFSYFGKDWRKYVEQKADFISDYKVLVSEPHTIGSLGWHAETNIYTLAKLMIEGHE